MADWLRDAVYHIDAKSVRTVEGSIPVSDELLPDFHNRFRRWLGVVPAAEDRGQSQGQVRPRKDVDGFLI